MFCFQPRTVYIFFAQQEGPVWTINLACFIFLGDRQRAQCERSTLPSLFFLEQQKAQCERSTLPTLIIFVDRQKAQCERSTLYFFLPPARRASVNNEPCMFLKQSTLHVFFKQSTLHVFYLTKQPCMFCLNNQPCRFFFVQHEGPMSRINLACFFHNTKK